MTDPKPAARPADHPFEQWAEKPDYKMSEPEMCLSVWIVMDGDYDSDWVVAVYQSEALAQAHVDQMGGRIYREEVRGSLYPDVADPAKVQERAEERARRVAEFTAYQQHTEQTERWAEAARPNPPHMCLCSCQTFTDPHWTEHGYCRFCGCWSPTVFRAHMGDAALQAQLDDLERYKRDKMRSLLGLA